MQHDFTWVKKRSHQKILNLLQGRFVGGSVRNTLLGKNPDDFDVATPLHPEIVMEILSKSHIRVVPTGIAHGTVTAIIDNCVYEVTTLRRDVETDGRNAVIAYTDSWEEDALRRDFTMNALSVDANGDLYDYCDGMKDALAAHIRFIGDPAQRIQEDYLRILRFFRFWVWYGNTFDEKSLEACNSFKKNLTRLSRERITKEYLKILEASYPWKVINIMNDYGFFLWITGQKNVENCGFFLSLIEKHCGYQAPAWVRLSALSGCIPPAMLVLSKEMIHNMCTLKKDFSWSAIYHWVYEHSIHITKQRVYLHAAELCEHFQQKTTPTGLQAGIVGGEEQEKAIVDICETLQRTLAKLDRDFPPFPLRGQDLMAYGVQGKELGKALKNIKNWWIAHHMEPSHEECIDFFRIHSMNK